MCARGREAGRAGALLSLYRPGYKGELCGTLAANTTSSFALNTPWSRTQRTADLTKQRSWRTRLGQEHVAAGATRPLLFVRPRAHRQHDDRNMPSRWIALESGDQRAAVEWARQENAGDDNVCS